MSDNNGHANAPPKNGARHSLNLARMEPPAADNGLPAWMVQMRRAAIECISEEDVKDIVKGQVERAKKGEASAIRFVFEQVLGGGQSKASTFIQNNYGADDASRPDKPTEARPGSSRKIEAARRRVEAGLNACDPDDGPDVNLD